MAIGAITVPTYSTNTTNDHLHVLSDSGAKAAIVSTNRLAERLIPAIDQTDEVQFIIALETPEAVSKKAKLLKWDDIIQGNKGSHSAVCELAKSWNDLRNRLLDLHIRDRRQTKRRYVKPPQPIP